MLVDRHDGVALGTVEGLIDGRMGDFVCIIIGIELGKYVDFAVG